MWPFNRPKIKAREKIIGKNVKFGKNVVITGFKNGLLERLSIGDNCIFGDNVKIIVAPCVVIGYGNTIHANVSIVGSNCFWLGNKNWIGQDAYLDTTGGLIINNHNTIGIRSMIWSHMIRPQKTYGVNPTPRVDHKTFTRIGSYCWTNPGSQICPGIVLADGTIVLNGAIVTKNTECGKVYAGIPAKKVEIKKWM